MLAQGVIGKLFDCNELACGSLENADMSGISECLALKIASVRCTGLVWMTSVASVENSAAAASVMLKKC